MILDKSVADKVPTWKKSKGLADKVFSCSLIMIVLEKLVLTIKLEMFLSARFLDTFMVRVTIAHFNLHLLL